MGLTIKQNVKVAVVEEVTEGTYVAPSASDYILPLADGLELTPAKEVLERNNLNASLFADASRSGIKSVSGTIPVEFKSGDAAGNPEYFPLVEAALGSAATGSTANASSTGHTTTVINFAATAPFSVGDIVLVKEAGAYHVSPITAIVTDTSIELLVAMAGAPADAVEVDVLNKSVSAESGFKSLSVTKNVEDAVAETAAGCRPTTMALENWTTGQQPNLSFGFEGLSFTRTISAIGLTPTFDASLPVIALQACIYQDGVSLPVNECSWSLENTLGYQSSTCSENGRVGSRVTASSISGSVNPYKQDDSVAQFDKWEADTEFSLFGYAYNATSTSGEFGEIVSFYFPKCQFTELGEEDQDGLLQDTLGFKVNKDSAGNTAVIAFG